MVVYPNYLLKERDNGGTFLSDLPQEDSFQKNAYGAKQFSDVNYENTLKFRNPHQEQQRRDSCHVQEALQISHILVFPFLILSGNYSFRELHYKKECQYDLPHKQGFLSKKDVPQLILDWYELKMSTLPPQINNTILEFSYNIGGMRCNDYLHLATKRYYRLQKFFLPCDMK